MHNQSKKTELKQRASTVKKALIEAGTQGMQIPELLALVQVHEPNLNRDTLAIWVADHERQAQAVRKGRTRNGYIWYHRGAHPKAPIPTPLAHSTPAQGRVITLNEGHCMCTHIGVGTTCHAMPH